VYRASGISFIRSQNVYDNWFEPTGLAFIDDQAAEALAGVTVRAGDVLLNITGDSVARCCLVPSAALPARVSQRVMILRPVREELDSGYLLACLVEPTMKSRLLQLAGAGATRPALTKDHVASLSVHLPPLAEQRAIAEALGALDEKIEANDRTRSSGVELLRALFHELTAPVLAQIAEGDPLPLGWRLDRLESVLEVLETGSRPRGGVSRYLDGVPSLGAESVLGLARYDFSKTKYVPFQFFKEMKRGHVQDHDVLLYKDGGRPGEFEPHVSLLGEGFPFPQFCINEHVYRLRAAAPFSQEFLFFWLSSDPVLEEMRRRGTGVAIPGLNSTAVKHLPITLPPNGVIDGFTAVAEPLVSLALRSSRESRVLAQLRDALLPKLLSGELRVRDAETLVEEAV
jgi:type I restriction enzyme S subunit